MNIKEILSEQQKTVDRCKKSNASIRGWNTNIKVLHLEVILTHIKDLEAENKRLREAGIIAKEAWDGIRDDTFTGTSAYLEERQTLDDYFDALSKDSE